MTAENTDVFFSWEKKTLETSKPEKLVMHTH